ILDQGGSLKAEHGTGRMMAPFVRRQYGDELYGAMQEIKRLCDPENVLNPGVVLVDDPDAHLRDLKTVHEVEPEVDRCVECGFCEPVCPSRDLTTTPRQRIVLRREMARQPSGSPLLAKLIEEYEYDGLETCAADGMCATTCPLGIDTGVLVKELRAAEHGEREERAALRAAQRWDRVEAGARSGLAWGAAISRALGEPAMERATGAVRSLIGPELVPGWEAPMPPPADSAPPPTVRDGAAAVYLPACV